MNFIARVIEDSINITMEKFNLSAKLFSPLKIYFFEREGHDVLTNEMEKLCRQTCSKHI